MSFYVQIYVIKIKTINKLLDSTMGILFSIIILVGSSPNKIIVFMQKINSNDKIRNTIIKECGGFWFFYFFLIH